MVCRRHQRGDWTTNQLCYHIIIINLPRYNLIKHNFDVVSDLLIRNLWFLHDVSGVSRTEWRESIDGPQLLSFGPIK